MEQYKLQNSPYLQTTRMLDFDSEAIQHLVSRRGWKDLTTYDAIGSIYHFVRDEIRFGYNADDSLPASRVLRDGYGQCNTKGTLLMALLRAVGIPTRFHGFTIYNALQKGAIPSYVFWFAPDRIIHSWVEVLYEDNWINLEGFIIDKPYLQQIQDSFAQQCGDFSGYGVATRCLSEPRVDWNGEDTYIQREGIADDFGVYTQPDDFYREHGTNLSGPKRLLYRYLIRHLMNINVNKIRRKGVPNKELRSILAKPL